jgi:protein-disulfide isomerase
MRTDPTTLKTVLSSALVAAAITAGGLGLFIAGQSQTPEPAEQAQETREQKPALTDAQKQAVEETVRDYLVRNPEILIEMSSELERKQASAEQESRKAAIAENAEDIYGGENALVAGNPDGDVTVVEFFDYNCGFCKRAFSDLTKLIENDSNVRVVLKEFPIFGEHSIGASKVAIAAREQGRYFDVHAALLEQNGRVTQEVALRKAEELGLDMEKLKRGMEAPQVTKIIDETRALAQELGVQGTPFYLVGDRVVPGAPEDLYNIFVETVAEVRENGCSAGC